MPNTAKKNSTASFHMPSEARSRAASRIPGTFGTHCGRIQATAHTARTYSAASTKPGMNAAAYSFGNDCSATMA
jgi:hypothetical protein